MHAENETSETRINFCDNVFVAVCDVKDDIYTKEEAEYISNEVEKP
jgi:hypothetical protein